MRVKQILDERKQTLDEARGELQTVHIKAKASRTLGPDEVKWTETVAAPERYREKTLKKHENAKAKSRCIVM